MMGEPQRRSFLSQPAERPERATRLKNELNSFPCIQWRQVHARELHRSTSRHFAESSLPHVDGQILSQHLRVSGGGRFFSSFPLPEFSSRFSNVDEGFKSHAGL